ncbi:hypothetical protein H0H92_003301 [Tricholoma furcatifolium]|nr:hypothetical protein H0H92_003301 [Tricholoma furcatifolium]
MPASASADPNQQQDLNISDALHYIDTIKTMYRDKPEVYTGFLDIMKDFKSQAIDTNAVISRVAALFRDNPMLIHEFGAFLPRGYTVRISDDGGSGGVTVIITTPQGTTVVPVQI